MFCDISNISGNLYGCWNVCYGRWHYKKKNLSRRFKIKTVFEQDDPRCMQEVVERRLRHSIDKEDDGFGKLPDLIFADGGITQNKSNPYSHPQCGERKWKTARNKSIRYGKK